MNRTTARRLNRINLEFYERHAEEFSATRSAPWPGWERIVERIATECPGERLSVLDVGCGNARFARFLDGRVDFEYLGIDSSPRLLEIAAAGLDGVERRLARHDLAAARLGPALAERRFDLIAAFGLLHHLPGFELRRRLVAELAHALAPGGLLALGFWQFADHERFRRRFVPWDWLNRVAEEPIDLEQLEPGDHLLAWGETTAEGAPGPVRYCHHADPPEAERLTAGLGLEPADRFLADGGLNLYALLRRPGSTARA